MSNWKPLRIFISHARVDKREITTIQEFFKSKSIIPYVCEIKLTGRALLDEIKKEMINCGAFLLLWTEYAADVEKMRNYYSNQSNNEPTTRDIINFELGLASFLNIPIFVIKMDPKSQLPWYVEHLTTYEKINGTSLEEALNKIDISEFLDNITFEFPPYSLFKYGRRQSDNEFIMKEGIIAFPEDYMINQDFQRIIHFEISNRMKFLVRDFRLVLDIPNQLIIDFDEGDVGRGSQKNDIFWMRKTPSGRNGYYRIKLIYPSLPAEETVAFELGIRDIINIRSEEVGNIFCSIQADNILRREKEIELRIRPAESLKSG
jgi:hypothetical protein